MQSVCVIGAGPSGLGTLNAFVRRATAGTTTIAATPNGSASEAHDHVAENLGVKLICFEKQADLGGQWRFDGRTGTDEHSEPVPNSIYRDMWTNSPKEGIEMGDYTFDDHFGRPVPSFLPSPVFLRYVTARADRAGLRKYVRTSTAVHWVCWRDDLHKFEVTVCDYEPGRNRAAVDDATTAQIASLVSDETDETTGARTYKMHFDRVVICSGHFSEPNIPSIDGLPDFQGRVLHSHELRDAAEFSGRAVLCIGAGLSGEDVALQAVKFGAHNVVVSYRLRAPVHDWPENVELLPQVERVGRDGVVTFVNGEKRSVDVVVLCTGYLHSFPFVEPALRLHARNTFVIRDLFRGVVSMRHRQLYYVGMQNHCITLNMFEAQASYVCKLISTKNAELDELSEADMEAEMDEWVQRSSGHQLFENNCVVQGEYIKTLIERVDNHPITTAMVDRIVTYFTRLVRHRNTTQQGVVTARELRFESVITGTMAADKELPWTKCYDDSEEAFLAMSLPRD